MNNFEDVKKSFSRQAEKFSAYHMSKAEYTNYLIKNVDAAGTEHTLEVAAGTCICARAMAPYVKDVVCLDLTEEMLTQGIKLAAQEGIHNISFVAGNAMNLPFEDETFDLVLTRLSLHHFTQPEIPFREMQRVLKKGGKLVVWDMEATTECLRDINDQIETMRDKSHTKILSKKELEAFFAEGFTLQHEETIPVPVNLQSWMNLTDTPGAVQKEIVSRMNDELNGGSKTGFYPYLVDGEICFDHRWLLLIGKKTS